MLALWQKLFAIPQVLNSSRPGTIVTLRVDYKFNLSSIHSSLQIIFHLFDTKLLASVSVRPASLRELGALGGSGGECVCSFVNSTIPVPHPLTEH